MNQKKVKLSIEFLVLCDQIILSRENKLSIIGIFDQIFLDKIPGSYPKMTVVGVIKGSPGSKHKIKLLIENPKAEAVVNQELEMEIGQNSKSNIITELVNFPLSLDGIYSLKLMSDGSVLGESPFSVRRVTPPTSVKPPIVN